MKTKKLFNDLNKLGRKGYYHRNGDECFVFPKKDFAFEICKSMAILIF